ncbi:MAG: 4'-phosphopantetheinyl transferase superfamily protein [Bacteroidetes bacterium]|nr:MAG: 4'-phosphopantetheinyl transferase superfamily protein [Bacteroidota bacterium]
MPFLPLKSNLPDVKIGAWKIEEDELYFMERVKLYEHEWQRLAKIVHPEKRLEWLSSRLCLKELIKISNEERVESLNTETGKPYLSNNSHFISYTHSTGYAAAVASPRVEVGIDIEYLKRTRNQRTRFLFMNDEELDYFHANESFELFILIWSSKESLYKISGPGFAFKHNIALDFTNFQLRDNGKVTAYVHKDDIFRTYEVSYYIHPEFLLTYTCDSLPAEALPSPAGTEYSISG